MRHLGTGDEYTALPDGTVKVVTTDGLEGIFGLTERAETCVWVSGDFRHPDAHMVQWVRDAWVRKNRAAAT